MANENPAKSRWSDLVLAIGMDTSFADEMHTVYSIKLDMEKATEDDLIAFMTQKPQSFDEWVQKAKAGLTEKLLQQGFPHPLRNIFANGSKWRAIPNGVEETPALERWPTHVKKGETITLGWKFVQDTSERFSDPWFAGRLIELIHACETANQEDRLGAAWIIGHTVATWESRTHYPNVRRGKLNHKASSKGGATRSRELSDWREEILEKMRSYIEIGHSVSRAAHFVAKEGIGSSKDANRKIWERHTK